jgi:hypothetical protein
MLTMLVLVLQTATLEADTAKAAMTCAQALTIVDANAKSPMQLTSQFTYLAMQSVKAKPDGPFFEQLNKVSETAGEGSVVTPEQAKLLVRNVIAAFRWPAAARRYGCPPIPSAATCCASARSRCCRAPPKKSRRAATMQG